MHTHITNYSHMFSIVIVTLSLSLSLSCILFATSYHRRHYYSHRLYFLSFFSLTDCFSWSLGLFHYIFMHSKTIELTQKKTNLEVHLCLFHIFITFIPFSFRILSSTILFYFHVFTHFRLYVPLKNKIFTRVDYIFSHNYF